MEDGNKNRERNRKNNGFSLVELIVVIAIMAVVAGASVTAVGLLSGRAAKESRDLIMSALQSARVSTMGKKSVVTTLKKDTSSGVYHIITVETLSGTSTTKDRTLDGSSKVTVYYSTADDPDYNDNPGAYSVADGGIEIIFDRSSGAQSTQITSIVVVQGSHNYGIRLYPETGKMETE